MKDATKFLAHNPTLLATYGDFKLYEHPIRGDAASIYMVTPDGFLVNTWFYDLGDFEHDGLALCVELMESAE